MRAHRCIALLATGAMSLLFSSAHADQVLEFRHGLNDYLGGTDCSLFGGAFVNNSSGSSAYLHSGAIIPQEPTRALIRYELPRSLKGRTILSAELVLIVEDLNPDQVGEVSYRVHRLTRGWGEGSTDPGQSTNPHGVAAERGDATWNSARHLISNWNTPGGDFVFFDSGTATIPVTDTVLSISGERLADDVRAWIERPDSNHGWLLVGDEERSATNIRFRSSEYIDSTIPSQGLDSRPLLRIVLEDLATATPTPTPTPTPVVTTSPPPTTTVSEPSVADALLGRVSGTTAPDRNGDGRLDAADLVATGGG